MYRRFFICMFALVAILLPSHIINAQTNKERYCPDGKIFNDAVAVEGNSPWIDVIVDPDWKQKELVDKRHITGDIPLTPIYNLVVRIKPIFNSYCVDGKEIVASDLPASLPIKGFILVGEGKNTVIIAGTGSFLLNKVKDPERGFIYEWKLKGWPGGIASGGTLENLITAIAAGNTVTTALDITKKDGTTVRQTSSVAFNICVPIWGNGEHNFATMRGKASQLQVDKFVDKAEKSRIEFGSLDPFKQNQSHFSYSNDLTLHDDSTWLKITKSGKNLRDLFNNKIPQASSCKGSKLYILYTNEIKMGGGGTVMKDKTIEGLTELNVGSVMITSHNLAPSWIAVHEAGHAFAGLVDEDSRAGVTYASLFPSLKRNCSINPSIDYLFDKTLYGATDQVTCIAKNLVERTKPLRLGEKIGLDNHRIIATLYRPSQGSLMNVTFNTGKFNVISCGYVMAAINSEPTDKEHAEKYWPACEDRLGTDRSSQSLRSEPLIPFRNLLAAVGSVLPETSTQSEDPSEEFLLADNFTEKWSEFIQILPETEETPPPEYPEPTISESAPIEDNAPGGAAGEQNWWQRATGAVGDFFGMIWDGTTGLVSNTWNGVANFVGDVFTPSTFREDHAPASGSATSPNFNPPSSYPVRTLVLNTLGNTVQASSYNIEKEAQLQELSGGQAIKSWKVKYEKKGHARFVCDPPVLNVSFDKADSKGNKRELFTGISTFSGNSVYPAKSQLQYQKIRMVPDCSPPEYYSEGSGYGFGDKISPHLREYFLYTALRALGVPTVDVIGFADVSFISPDPQYNGKTFRYMLLQRNNEKDDEKPIFAEQFGLDLSSYIEDGKNNDKSPNWNTSNRLSTISYTEQSTGKEGSFELDIENNVRLALLVAFAQDNDRALLHNEDYSKKIGSDVWMTIPYGFDYSLSSCDSEIALNRLKDFEANIDQQVDSKLFHLSPEKRAEYKKTYYRIAREIFLSQNSLNRMLALIDTFPSSSKKDLLKEYIRLTFYRFGQYMNSPEFAAFTGESYVSTTLFTDTTNEEYYKSRENFLTACNVNIPRREVPVKIAVVSSSLSVKKTERTDEIRTDEMMTAIFEVDVTAPTSQDLPLRKQAVFSGFLKNAGDNSTEEIWGLNYERPSALPETVGPSWTIPAGKTIRFTVIFQYITDNKEGGDYTASLKELSPGSYINPIPIPTNKTNQVTIVGITRPVITKVAPDTLPINKEVKVFGKRLNPVKNTLIIVSEKNNTEKEIILPSKDGETLIFIASKYGITPGRYSIRLLEDNYWNEIIINFLSEEIPAIVIDSTLPTSVELGQKISVRGKGFEPTNIIEVRPTKAPFYSFLYTIRPEDIQTNIFGDQLITFTIPKKSSAGFPLSSGQYSLQAFSQKDGSESNAVFFEIISSTLQIDSITPNTAGAETEITINGSGFSAKDNTVVFQDAGYTTINADSVDGKSIRVRVPAGPTGLGVSGKFSGKIKVAVYTEGQISNIVDFTVIPTPVNNSPTLTANNSKGPLSIELGNHVTLAWTIPTSVTDCTRNWTKDPLIIDVNNQKYPAGCTEGSNYSSTTGASCASTSIVSPRFPSTIYTISCKDKNGNPVGTDSVEIRTEDYTNQKSVQPTLPPLLGSDGKPLPVRKESATISGTEIPSGSKVKVIVSDNQPPADFVVLAKGETNLTPDKCIDATSQGLFQKKEQPFRSDLEKGWAQDGVCATNIATATMLKQKIDDIKTTNSIGTIQNFVDSLALSVNKTKNLTTLDGASFIIVPAGEAQPKTYGQINDINIKCVSDKMVPLGTGGMSAGHTYIEFTPALKTQTNTVKQKIQKSYDSYLKEKNKGTVIGSTLDRLTALQTTLKGPFILITADAGANLKAASQTGNTLPLSVKLEKSADGKVVVCPIGAAANFQLNIGGRDVLAAGKFLKATISLNGKIFEHDCIPEAYLLKELKDGVQKNLAFFQKLKDNYQSVEQQLKALVDKNYNCTVPPVKIVRKSVMPSDASMFNLSVAQPTITSPTAGNSSALYAGETTIHLSIVNKEATIKQTFGNTIQYRDVTSNGPWTDWVKFEIAGLVAGEKTDIAHTWTAGAGKWEFRLVANNGNNISETTSVNILPRGDAVAPSVPPASSAPKLSLTTPTISGTQAGIGKLRAGSMTISEKVTNTGVGSAPPFQILLLYSQNGTDWSDWIRLDSLKLAPQAERTMIYTWNGNAGKWYFKACEDIKDTCSEPLLVEIIQN